MSEHEWDIGELPEHESGVRRLVSEGKGLPYHALRSLDEARQSADGVVVFEGDDGGQIYVVCPAQAIRCSEDDLRQLLSDIDRIEWPHNDGNSRRIYFERHEVGEPIWGGMGGGEVTSDIWIHPRLIEAGLEGAIRGVIGGERRSL